MRKVIKIHGKLKWNGCWWQQKKMIETRCILGDDTCRSCSLQLNISTNWKYGRSIAAGPKVKEKNTHVKSMNAMRIYGSTYKKKWMNGCGTFLQFLPCSYRFSILLILNQPWHINKYYFVLFVRLRRNNGALYKIKPNTWSIKQVIIILER